MKAASILIVEDEVILAMEYEIIVREMGYVVPRIAFSGYDAIILSGQYKPDIVLMDIKLAGHLNGINAAKQIQDQLQIPVVFVTGNTDDDTRKQALEIQPAGYLTKPLNENILQTTLKTILN
jgi:DNA-binding response OmpR family regulator